VREPKMKILIVEDEKEIANSLKKNFDEEGFRTTVCFDGADALEVISTEKFDLILLDWRLPKISGIEVCKRVRNANDQTPIIILTALTNVTNKIDALNSCADDYITKPFSFDEVLARVNALIRRNKMSSSIIEFDNLSLNLISHTLFTETTSIKLSEMEFELLRYFLENKDKIISRETLCEDVWKLKFTPGTNVVDVTVKNLRQKLETETSRKYIKTVYGEGYIFITS
jgi:DNA-binding response OmpR family regulator